MNFKRKLCDLDNGKSSAANVKIEKISKKSVNASGVRSIQDLLIVKPREIRAVGASEEETEKVHSVSDELQ
jgi:hypothetical protein